MFRYDPLATLAARRRRRSSRSSPPMTRRARGRGAVGGLRRRGRPPGAAAIRAASFRHDGHNLMRYRPEAVSAAILSVAGEADA